MVQHILAFFTGCSPFRALYAHDPNMGATPVLTETTNSTVSEMLEERATHTALLKEQLAIAQTHMKHQADRKRTERVFQVGEPVLLKLQPYAQASAVNRLYPKLAYKYFGPITILERIGSVAYRLDLPPNSLVHPVFHISQLKPFTPNHTPVFANITKLADLSVVSLAPKKILQRRLVKKGNKAIPQVLLKWTHLPESSATWEDYYVVKQRFPDAVAWGQATSEGGGNVMDGATTD